MDTPDLTSRHYRGFTLDESEEAVSAQFTRRYGAPPEYIVESLGLLYVGPIPEPDQPVQFVQQLAMQLS